MALTRKPHPGMSLQIEPQTLFLMYVTAWRTMALRSAIVGIILLRPIKSERKVLSQFD
ncbi:hypothetical protein B0O80DRAFT_498112 [Mortierella sp. GBAus27b]|nr:hypothetical protein B0O80DRAFT_498112 [Mortierella sp. GBAus27b]